MFFTVRWIETIVLKAMCTLYRIALVQAAKTFRIGLLFTHKTLISDHRIIIELFHIKRSSFYSRNPQNFYLSIPYTILLLCNLFATHVLSCKTKFADADADVLCTKSIVIQLVLRTRSRPSFALLSSLSRSTNCAH